MSESDTTMIPLFSDPNCKIYFGLIDHAMVFVINTALGARVITDRPFAKEVETILQQQLPWLPKLKVVEKPDMTKEWIPYFWNDGNLILDPIVYSDMLEIA